MGEAKRRRLVDPNYGIVPKTTKPKGWTRGSRWRVFSDAWYGAALPAGESRQTVRHSMKNVGRPGGRVAAGRFRKSGERNEADPRRGPTRAPFSKGLSAAKFAAARLLSKNGRRRLEGRERAA